MTPARLSLFSGLAVKDVLEQSILPDFCRTRDIEIDATFEPTKVLASLIDDGARPDVMIGVRAGMDSLVAAGVLRGETVGPLLRSAIGVAVPPDARQPDISTVEALVDALRSARSVAYSRTGASGVYFAGLLERLGIADDVNSRATVVAGGFAAETLTDGRADLAIQQIVELRSVPGVRIVGPLPDDVQQYVELSAGLGAGAGAPAAELLRHFRSESAATAFRAAGLDTATLDTATPGAGLDTATPDTTSGRSRP